jgi:hypothetical protein
LLAVLANYDLGLSKGLTWFFVIVFWMAVIDGHKNNQECPLFVSCAQNGYY